MQCIFGEQGEQFNYLVYVSCIFRMTYNTMHGANTTYSEFASFTKMYSFLAMLAKVVIMYKHKS